MRITIGVIRVVIPAAIGSVNMETSRGTHSAVPDCSANLSQMYSSQNPSQIWGEGNWFEHRNWDLADNPGPLGASKFHKHIQNSTERQGITNEFLTSQESRKCLWNSENGLSITPQMWLLLRDVTLFTLPGIQEMDPTSYKIHPICNLKANKASQGAAANMLTKQTAKVQENDPQSLLAHGTWCMAACAGYSYYAGTDYYGSSRGASTPGTNWTYCQTKLSKACK